MNNAGKKNILTLALLLLYVLIALFALMPFGIMLKSSLEPYSSIVSLDFHFLPNPFTIENYIEVMTQYELPRWFLNSVVVAVVAILLNLVVDTLSAYALQRLEYPGKKLMNVLVISAQIIPVQVTVVPLYLMMVKLDWIDTYKGLILPVAISPFIIFFLRQSFMQIPKALDEAAIIDGCSRISVLWQIILPNSIPALGTSVVLKFMWVWGDYMWPSLVTKNNAMRTLPVGIATFQRAGGTIPWELVMPSAVLSSIPIVLLFLFLQKYFITGLTEGAIKG